MTTIPDIQIDDVMDYLRLDNDDDFSTVHLIAESAEAYIRSLCTTFEAGELPPEIRQAVFVLCAHWYDNRNLIGDARHREIPFAVSALIANYRDWDDDDV